MLLNYGGEIIGSGSLIIGGQSYDGPDVIGSSIVGSDGGEILSYPSGYVICKVIDADRNTLSSQIDTVLVNTHNQFQPRDPCPFRDLV